MILFSGIGPAEPGAPRPLLTGREGPSRTRRMAGFRKSAVRQLSAPGKVSGLPRSPSWRTAASVSASIASARRRPVVRATESAYVAAHRCSVTSAACSTCREVAAGFGST